MSQMQAIEAGAIDVALEDGVLEVYTESAHLHAVASALNELNRNYNG